MKISTCLLLFISVFQIYSKQSFAQVMKKDLGICGTTFSAIFKVDPKADPSIESIFEKQEEFCDDGRYEKNANYLISIYNEKNELVYDKKIYLNPVVFQESIDKKTLKFKKTILGKNETSRIVKFPVEKKDGHIFCL
jgi:hypothetical protein